MKNTFLRNILAVLAGIIVGSIVNMGIVILSDGMLELPEGMNPADAISIKEHMHLLTPKHFIFPFLAHALGTLVGAYATARIAASHKMRLAMTIGVFFLLGGITMVFSVGGPIWFNTLDLIVAYIPMAWLGYNLSQPKS